MQQPFVCLFVLEGAYLFFPTSDSQSAHSNRDMCLLRNLISAICLKETCGAFRFVMLSHSDSDSPVNYAVFSVLSIMIFFQ